MSKQAEQPFDWTGKKYSLTGVGAKGQSSAKGLAEAHGHRGIIVSMQTLCHTSRKRLSAAPGRQVDTSPFPGPSIYIQNRTQRNLPRRKFLTSNHARTHLTAVWVAHAIELIEETGSLEDEQAMAQAFRTHKGARERLLERAWVLGQRLGLDSEIERWKILQWPVGIAFCLIAYVTWWGLIATFARPDRPINAVIALATVLLIPTAIFVIWLVAVIQQFLSADSPGSFIRGGAFGALLAWIPLGGKLHTGFLAHGALAVLQKNRLTTWFFGLMSHALWSVVLLLVLVTLFVLFHFEGYSLYLKTTTGDRASIDEWIRASGQLPALLGFPGFASAPLDLTAMEKQSYVLGWWVMGCTFTYGLLPRLVALSGCWWILRGRKDRLQLDTSDPYFQKLLVRFHAMEPSSSEDLEIPPPDRSMPARRAHVPDQRLPFVLIGFELSDEHLWPPPHLVEQADLVRRVAGSFDERRTVLNEIAVALPQRALVVCDEASSPDRGTERFLREICGYCDQGAVLLAAASRSSQANALRWTPWIDSLELKNMTCLRSEVEANHWLNESNG